MRYRLYFLFISFWAIGSLDAQEVWPLERCVEYALNHNINIEQLKLSMQFADLDVDNAVHARYPNLNGSLGANANFGRTIDPVSNEFSTETIFSNNLGLQSGVLIYNGGRLKNAIKQAEINAKASGYDLAQTQRDIALLVANAYLSVLFAQENLTITENQISLSKEQLTQMEKLIRAGSMAANEKLNLEAQIANNEQNLIANENAIATALLNLKQLMRLDVDKDIQVEVPQEDITILSDVDILTFKEVYNSALTTQPNIKAAEYDMQSAEMGIKIAESGLKPSLSAFGSLGTAFSNRGIRRLDDITFLQDVNVVFNNIPTTIGIEQTVPTFEDNPYFSQLNDNLSLGAGVSLSVPIYNNHVNRNNIERAKLNMSNVALTNEQLKDNLKTNVQQALADARAAKKQLASALKNVEAQQAAYANAEKRFKLGALNTYDFIASKNQLDIAQINVIIARYDYIFKSKVIDFYMGNPLKLN
jgi:outer membrane protein